MKKIATYFLLAVVTAGLFGASQLFAGSINGVTIVCPQSLTAQTQVVKDLDTNTFFTDNGYQTFVPLYKKFLEKNSQNRTGYVAGQEAYELSFPYNSGISGQFWVLKKFGTYDPTNTSSVAPLLGTYNYSATGAVNFPADFKLTQAELNSMGTAYRQEILSGNVRVADFMHGLLEIDSLVVMENECNSIVDITVPATTQTGTGTGTTTPGTTTTTTPSAIDPVLNQVLTAPADAPIEVIMTQSTITDNTAAFKFSVKAKAPGPATLMLSYATTAAAIGFDGTNTTSTRVVIHSDNTPVVNQVKDANMPPFLTNLLPGKQYFFQIKDTINNKLYQTVSFTTSSTTTITPPAPNQTSVNGMLLTVNNTVVTPATSDVNGKYNAKISGSVKPSTARTLGLVVYYGDNMNSFTGPVSVLAEQVLPANQEKPFEYTLSNLQAGTRYYFRIRESSQNIELTGNYDFVTQGAAPAGTVTPYDPNAGPGALLDYTFPTNLGAPDANVAGPAADVPTLVPCGKISDIGTPDENCQFRHIAILVGNVITFLLVLLIPLTVLACVYTGVQMILHRTIPADLIKYKDRLLKIGGGLLVMLLAFTIVATVMKAFLGDDAARYLLIDISNL